jgi:hypothetical protein
MDVDEKAVPFKRVKGEVLWVRFEPSRPIFELTVVSGEFFHTKTKIVKRSR